MFNSDPIKIWIDDDKEHRKPPVDYNLWVFTVEEAMKAIIEHNGNIEAVSFDHDLGQGGETKKIMTWLEEHAMYNMVYPFKIQIHTANSVEKNNLYQGALFCYEKWKHFHPEFIHPRPVVIDYVTKVLQGMDGLGYKFDT